MRTASLVAPAGARVRATAADPAPASAAAAVVPILARADGPAHRVADFASTQLFRVPVGAGSRLIALTCQGASYSANSVRIDNATFDAVRAVPTMQVRGARYLRAGGHAIEIVRTWRSDVVRRTGRPAPDDLRSLLPDPPRAPRELDALIGLGQGLTPTGDDLVCGFLAAARAYADPRLPEWTGLVRGSLRRTSDLSAEFLSLAADGHVCLELRELLLALGTEHLPSAVRRLRAVGHTSGSDLAHGVLRYLERTDTSVSTDSVTDHKES